jgi:hypothetical protein
MNDHSRNIHTVVNIFRQCLALFSLSSALYGSVPRHTDYAQASFTRRFEKAALAAVGRKRLLQPAHCKRHILSVGRDVVAGQSK